MEWSFGINSSIVLISSRLRGKIVFKKNGYLFHKNRYLLMQRIR